MKRHLSKSLQRLKSWWDCTTGSRRDGSWRGTPLLTSQPHPPAPSPGRKNQRRGPGEGGSYGWAYGESPWRRVSSKERYARHTAARGLAPINRGPCTPWLRLTQYVSLGTPDKSG